MMAVFLRIGILSFGGPTAQIALMHRELVERTRWLEEREFLRALSFCMLLPGPEAMQLATYAGWRLGGIPWGLISGILFVLPGAVVMLALAVAYGFYSNAPFVEALFLGIKAAILVIVLDALLRVARRALDRPAHWLIALAAFLGLFVFEAPYPLIVAAAAAVGAMLGGPEGARRSTKPIRWQHTAMLIAAGLVIWLGPLFLLDGILRDIAFFFVQLAVVTFGGAYAVLAWMAQDAVTALGWLSPGEMMDGLGLAETTPGPLILVTEFVGFLAAFREGGLGLGLAGAAVTLWATFVPCFLWIFAGAPYLDRLTANPRLAGALTGITAAVVGVIANLSLWFALHTLFAQVERIEAGPLGLWVPHISTLDWRVVGLATLAGILLLRLHWSLVSVLSVSAVLGLALSLV